LVSPAQGPLTVPDGSFNKFTPEAAKNIEGCVLVLHGAEDPVAPMEEVTSLISQHGASQSL